MKDSTQTEIHPTAIIEKGAELDAGVSVGAYAYVGEKVKIGKNTNVHHHATVEGDTQLGEDNEISPYAYIGAKTHDLKYEGGVPGLKVGDRNTFREYVTVHLATFEGVYTTLGSDNVLLAYSHVAHECVVGNHLVMSSHSALAGHVHVQDHVNVGWNVGVHQFCRVGAYAMLGACSKVVQDVLPYMIVDGNPAAVRTINKVGIERNGFSKEQVQLVRLIYKTMYREGLNRTQAIERLEQDSQADDPILKGVIEFVQESERGLA